MDVTYTVRELRLIKCITQKLTHALREECNFEPVPINFLLNLPEFKYARTKRPDIEAVLEYESRLGSANIASWVDKDNTTILQAISKMIDVGPIQMTPSIPTPNPNPRSQRPPKHQPTINTPTINAGTSSPPATPNDRRNPPRLPNQPISQPNWEASAPTMN